MPAGKNTPRPAPGSMLNQKTNEDFNKKKPNPTDPTEQKGRRTTVVPDFGDGMSGLENSRRTTVIPDLGDDDLYPLQSETAAETGNWKITPNKSEGSE